MYLLKKIERDFKIVKTVFFQFRIDVNFKKLPSLQMSGSISSWTN